MWMWLPLWTSCTDCWECPDCACQTCEPKVQLDADGFPYPTADD